MPSAHGGPGPAWPPATGLGRAHTETKCRDTGKRETRRPSYYTGSGLKTRISVLKHCHFIKIKSALVTTLLAGESPKPKRTRGRREACPASGTAAVWSIFVSLAGAALLRRDLKARQVKARLLLQPGHPAQREQPKNWGWQSLTPFLSLHTRSHRRARAGARRGRGGTARLPVPRERAKAERSTKDSELLTLESGKVFREVIN